MGCGSSKDPKIGVADSIKPVDNYSNHKSNNYSNSRSNNTTNRNGFKQVELKSSEEVLKNYNSNMKPDEKSRNLIFKRFKMIIINV